MAKKALEGVKVVDFGWAAAGPIVGLQLAHHGATVIRVESSHSIDIGRLTRPYKDDKPGLNRSGVFAIFNNSKFGMALNLAHPRATEVAKRLVTWADIVSENFVPGVMKRRGLDYEELKKIKPDIIMASACNMGQTGPEATRPGWGSQAAAYAGVTHFCGWPDRPPVNPVAAYTDYITPRFVVVALLAALDYRRRTGKGQHIDLSQMEVGVHFIGPTIMDYTINKRIQTRDGNRCSYAAPHGNYPCQGDDRWCAIGVFSDEEWDALCQVMGNPKWAKEAKFATLLGRKENEDELNERLGEWTRGFTAEEVMEKLQAAGVAAGVVKNIADIQDDPQLAYRHYYWELEHPEIGIHHCDTAAYILPKTPAEVTMPAPLMGQHTEYVCREVLGMGDEEFVDLLNQGVFE